MNQRGTKEEIKEVERMTKKTAGRFISGITKSLEEPNQYELTEETEIKLKKDIKKKTNKTPILIKLDDDLLEYITEQAQRDRIPRTTYIKKLIIEDMKKGR